MDECEDCELDCGKCSYFWARLKEEDEWWEELFLIEKIRHQEYETPVLIRKRGIK